MIIAVNIEIYNRIIMFLIPIAILIFPRLYVRRSAVAIHKELRIEYIHI